MAIPLKFGSDEHFAIVREFLRASGYDAQGICARLGVERLGMFEGLQPRTESWGTRDALNVLISLFALGERVSRQDAAAIPVREMEALRGLGVVADFGETIYAPVAMGPVDDLFFVSDRWCSADGSKWTIEDDAVYPAITPNTLKFLDTVPLEECEALLDVGTGTGVGALIGAKRYARRAWGFDITERSARFTEFNCRLNGIANVTVGEGDLYAPAAEQTFDRIIAHPPYVPVLSHHWTFHDGGDDGELLTRRLVEGLPRYLRMGGMFHCYAMGSDREQPFEERAREWLGASEREFDVQIVVRNRMEPMQFAMQTVLKHDAGQDLGKWKQLFDGYKVRELVFGTITITRFAEKRRAFTVRNVAGPRTGRAELERQRRLFGELGPSRVMEMRPKLVETVELVVHHVVEGGKFEASGYEARTAYPFVNRGDIAGWAAVFLGRCDGESTVRELLEGLKSDGYVKEDLDEKDFAEWVGTVVVRGFVVSD
jgi:SAM-dependent methyltransferase